MRAHVERVAAFAKEIRVFADECDGPLRTELMSVVGSLEWIKHGSARTAFPKPPAA